MPRAKKVITEEGSAPEIYPTNAVEAALPEKYVEIKNELSLPWWKDRKGFIIERASEYVSSIVDKNGKINMDYADQAVELATKLADKLDLK